jgi:hypothetical protein
VWQLHRPPASAEAAGGGDWGEGEERDGLKLKGTQRAERKKKRHTPQRCRHLQHLQPEARHSAPAVGWSCLASRAFHRPPPPPPNRPTTIAFARQNASPFAHRRHPCFALRASHSAPAVGWSCLASRAFHRPPPPPPNRPTTSAFARRSASPSAHRRHPCFAPRASKLTASFSSQPALPCVILLTKGDLPTHFQLRLASHVYPAKTVMSFLLSAAFMGSMLDARESLSALEALRTFIDASVRSAHGS